MFRWLLILLLIPFVAFCLFHAPVAASSAPSHSDSGSSSEARFENAPVPSITASKVLLLPGLIADARYSVDLESDSGIRRPKISHTCNSTSLEKLRILRI
jgi:hypothetical protein